MPTGFDPVGFQLPEDPSPGYIDDPTAGAHKGGGGQNPFQPGFFSGGGGGGGASGGFFGGPQFSGFYGVNAMDPTRRRAMASYGAPPPAGAPPYQGPTMGGRGPASPMGMIPTRGQIVGRYSPQAPAASPGTYAGDPSAPQSYWDLLMRRGSGQATGYAPNITPNDYSSMIDQIIAGAGHGNWDPNGDPEIMDAIRQHYQEQGAADEGSAALASDLDSRGRDFYGRSLARTEARAGARNASAGEASSARLAQMSRIQQLRDQYLQWELQRFSGQQARDAYLADKQHDESKQGGLGGILGDLAPIGLSFIPGVGPALGAAYGAMSGGGKKGRSDTSYDEYP